MRKATLSRNTKETQITLSLNVDGEGTSRIDTGVGFMNHMLDLFAFHGGFDLDLTCKGDLDVDSHHSVEDIGIALGLAFKDALGERRGITRYGHFTMPMDEALVSVDLDISNRPYLVFNVELDNVLLGNFQSEMVEEFLRAFAFNAGITLHVNEHYGKNTHHIIEAIFKALARALKEAVMIDEAHKDKIVSSKGVL